MARRQDPGGRTAGLFLLAATGLIALAAACGGGQDAVPISNPTSTPSQPQPGATTVPSIPNGAPPAVNTSIHSVPLEDVVFDTFGSDFLRLSEASSQAIERLRDTIRPIYQPRYDGPEGGGWLNEEDLVIGYVGKSQVYAYPVKMLNFHEIVSDDIDGVPVLVTYCTLCANGVVFSRRLNAQVLLFGNTSALFENDLVMLYHQTGSYLFQVSGEAIVGTLTGERLAPLPSVTMLLGQCPELHPDTRMLSREQGFSRSYNYRRDPFEGYSRSVDALRFPFPVSTEKLDDRLRPSARWFFRSARAARRRPINWRAWATPW